MTLSALLLLFGLAQAPAPVAKAPARLSVAPAGRVQLGSIGPRESKTLAYTFTNRSAAPIKLHLAELAPGVTAAGPVLDAPLAPGASLGLTMTIDPTDLVGHQVRAIRLVTDDPNQGEYRLPVAMEVRPDLSVDSATKDFGAVAPFESPQAVFTFTRETGLPTVLRQTSALPPYLETEIVTQGAVSRLEATLRPALVPPGTNLGLETLVVETNAPQQSRFTLYLQWRLQTPIEATPSRIVFLDPAVQELALQLKSGKGEAFLLEAAQVEGEGFSVGPLPKSPASTQALTVRRQAQAEVRAVLVLRFKGQEQPLKVPLSYLPPTR